MRITSQYIKITGALLFSLCSLIGSGQQEFTLTTSTANIIAAKALVDIPGLTGNTDAIIIATPLGSTKSSNPHPTGAWYYSGKWNVFNCDFAAMIPGLTYKIQYFLSPTANAFLHLVTQQNLGAEGSYIDNPALNNKPDAQFLFFPNHSPDTRAGSWLNPNEAKAAYNPTNGKWYIANINNQAMQKGCAYNILVTSSPISHQPANPVTIGNTSQSCNCPSSLPPNGQAMGDLSGTYPAPIVNKILNRPLSNTAPAIGKVLKWNGEEWIPSNENTVSGSNNAAYSAGPGLALNGNEFSAANSTPIWNASKLVGRDIVTTVPKVGQVLKWGGASWYPADDSIANTSNSNPASSPNPLYSNTTILTGWNPETFTSTSYNYSYLLHGLSYIYHLTTNVKMLVSFNVPANTVGCIGCGMTGVYITINVNGTKVQQFYWEIVNNSNLLLSGTHLFSLPPGVYNIELKAQTFGPTINLGYTGTKSTMIIQVIPE